MVYLSKAPSFLLLVCLLGFPQISETIYTPSLPDIAHSFSTTDGLVELTLSIFFIGFAIGVFLWGIFADLIGRRNSILCGLIVYIVGSLLCCLAPSIYFLLAARFIQALGSSVGSVVTQTMIRDLYEGKERHQLFSSLGAPLAASPAIGPFLGGYIDQFFGWNANFIVLIAIGIVLFIFSFLTLSETNPAYGTGQGVKGLKLAAKKMCRDIRLFGFACLIGGCNGIVFSFYAEAPFLFIDLLGLTPGHYGIIGVIVASSIFLASLLSSCLNKSWDARQIILLGCGILLFGSIVLSLYSGLGFISPLLEMMGILALVLPLIVIFFGIGLVIPNSLSLALADYQDFKGTAGSLFGLAYYIVIAALTAGMGFIHSGSALPMPLYFVIITLLMCVGWFLTASDQNCEVKIA